MIALRQKNNSFEFVVTIAIVIAIGMWCGPALAAAAPGEPKPVVPSPSMFVVITHAGIVYAIAIVISVLTAVLIKGMNFVMAARAGNGTE